MNDKTKAFEDERDQRIEAYRDQPAMQQAAHRFLVASADAKYSYNFSWMGRPIIQYPQDIVAMQELIWRVRPDLIIETGIAHGGSLIFSGSMLELNALCGGPSDAYVLGIDIDIRDHNRQAIESHPMAKRIRMIQGSSTDESVIEQARRHAQDRQRVLVQLDSNHTHDHVLTELRAYAPLTSVGSYCVVFDTLIEDMPADHYPDRPWGPGNNPKTAVNQYLSESSDFMIDESICGKLMITVGSGGYLRRVR